MTHGFGFSDPENLWPDFIEKLCFSLKTLSTAKKNQIENFRKVIDRFGFLDPENLCSNFNL